MGASFPDVERGLVALLAHLVDGPQNAGSTTPADLDQRAKYLRVNRYGGSDDDVTDYASVDLDWFARTRDAAFSLANAGHTLLKSTSRHSAGGVLIDVVRTNVGVVERPWPGGQIRRFGASYTVGVRRPAS